MPKAKEHDDDEFDVADVAHDYFRRGWKPVPVKIREKRPRDNSWQDLNISEANIKEYFDREDNIGLQLGTRSGGLTDVDIDCPEALALADMILPSTGAIFGRRSKPKSHRLYKTDLSASEQKAAIQFREPPSLSTGGKPAMLVELRIGAGNKGAQTLAPGSLHPSGEAVRWHVDGDPADVNGVTLKLAVTELAVATLLVRHYPTEGSRHDGALTLGGLLARRTGADANNIRRFVAAVAEAEGDEDAEERGNSAAGAVELLRSGAPTPGLPRMREVWGTDVADTVAKWLGLVAESSTDDVEIERLARLDRVSYDRERERLAEQLGIRVGTLDKLVEAKRQDLQPDVDGVEFLAPVDPWSEPVNGKELLNDICDVFERHVVLSPSASLTCALWILHAFAHDAATHSPILDISSPTKRCGKTQLLGIAAQLAPKPLAAANVSHAVVFRAIDKWHPTLFIDEMDTFIAEKTELRGILNSGHTRASAHTIRCVGDDHEPTPFSTWTPKVFAHIGRIDPTLEDRSIRIELRRRLKSEKIERMPPIGTYVDLRRKSARWASDNITQLKGADPKVPAALNDRAADNWRPLLAIADACGFANEARDAALMLSELDDDETDAIVLLGDLANLFEGVPSLSSAEIVESLVAMEDRKWPEFRRGKPITPAQLAAMLKPFKIYPRKVRGRRDRERQRQGYTAKQFVTAFRRYLGE